MEIRLHAMLRQVAHAACLTVDLQRDQSVGDALRALVARQPALGPWIWNPDGSPTRLVACVLDGRDVRHLAGLDTPLGEARHLDLFPPVGGG